MWDRIYENLYLVRANNPSSYITTESDMVEAIGLEELTSEPEHPLPMTIDELLKGASASANNVPETKS